jgi:NADPH:quinone reductase-like Zn-dependent oxidoreductase
MGTHRDFNTVMSLVFDGKLRSVVDRCYPIAEVADAHARLAAGEQLGKITLALG